MPLADAFYLADGRRRQPLTAATRSGGWRAELRTRLSSRRLRWRVWVWKFCSSTARVVLARERRLDCLCVLG